MAPVEPFRSSWTDVQGVTVHARVSTALLPPGRPSVVLVPGYGLSGRYMVPVAERLAAHYPVYVPDLPGFGDSGDPGRTLSMAEQADALATWMEAIGLDRAALFGNSMGCQVVANLAVRHPHRVARVVLQGPITPPRERNWFWQAIRWAQNEPNDTSELRAIKRADYHKTTHRRMFWTFHHALRDAMEEKMPHIQAPVLIIRGQRDPICRQDWAEWLTRLAPNARLVVIPGVAHTLVYTSALELERVTRPFLDEEGALSSENEWSRLGRSNR